MNGDKKESKLKKEVYISGGWKKMKVDENRWKWLKVDALGACFLKGDDGEWKWMIFIERSWKGYKWKNGAESLWKWIIMDECELGAVH